MITNLWGVFRFTLGRQKQTRVSACKRKKKNRFLVLASCKCFTTRIICIAPIYTYLSCASAQLALINFICQNIHMIYSLFVAAPVATRKLPFQKFAARIVINTRKYDHITPLLLELNWLVPVATQPCLRNAATVFKCLTGRVPEYLSTKFIKR